MTALLGVADFFADFPVSETLSGDAEFLMRKSVNHNLACGRISYKDALDFGFLRLVDGLDLTFGVDGDDLSLEKLI